MFYCLPPVGHGISLEKEISPEQFLNHIFTPYRSFYFNSGAASLAVVIKAIIQLREVHEHGEVLVPAYACPEIVSAILWAGATPVLVDLDVDSSQMSLGSLEHQFTQNTVAVIAVSLFGIPERLKDIRVLAKKHDVRVIEDNAQQFPQKDEALSPDADAMVFSFGRGKPVSILSGGVLLIQDVDLIARVEEIGASLCYTVSNKFRLKAQLYNQLISPYAYWLPDSLPFLNIGQTVFKSLEEPELLSEDSIAYIPSNILDYWKRTNKVQSWVFSMLAEIEGMVDVALKICGPLPPNLLRYPVLIESKEKRSNLFEALKNRGLGVSCLYPEPLNQIDGLKALFSNQSKTQNAESFSSRLLTLPVHAGVRCQDVEQIGRIMRST